MPTAPKKKRTTSSPASVKKEHVDPAIQLAMLKQKGKAKVEAPKPKRKLKKAPSPAIYTLGPCGQAWQETQLHNRVAKLQSIGASEAQVAVLATRHFYQLSKWARIALKELFKRDRLARKGGN